MWQRFVGIDFRPDAARVGLAVAGVYPRRQTEELPVLRNHSNYNGAMCSIIFPEIDPGKIFVSRLGV